MAVSTATSAGRQGWSIATALRGWRYAGGKRDVRLDFLRGFSAFAMVVDHVEGKRSILYWATGGNRFYTSAAEAFVFISGFVMGIVYRDVIERHGANAALTKSLRRAGTLYLLTVFLTLSFPLVSWLIDAPWEPRLSPGEIPAFVVGVLTLHQTFLLADIMMMYTFLLLFAGPVIVLLAHGKTWWVLAGSWALWLLWQIWPEQVQFPWAVAGNDLFHIPAWQVIFMTALVAGYHRDALTRRLAGLSPFVPLTVSAGVLLLAAALYFDRLGPLSDHGVLGDQFFGKGDVPVGRIATFTTAFIFAYALVTVAWVPIRRAFGWLLMPLGHHALSAYALHIFVVALLWKVSPWLLGEGDYGLIETTLMQLAGVGLVWGGIVLWPKAVTLVDCCEACAQQAPARLRRWFEHGHVVASEVQASGSGAAQSPHRDRDARCGHPDAHADCP